MPSTEEGVYVGSRRTHYSISDYRPLGMTEPQRKFRTEAVPFNSTSADLNETPVELGRLGFKAVTGAGRYGRSDEKRDVRDEALEHDDNCDCADCAAANRAYGKTKDTNMLTMRKINQAHRKAFGQK